VVSDETMGAFSLRHLWDRWASSNGGGKNSGAEIRMLDSRIGGVCAGFLVGSPYVLTSPESGNGKR
jgi:hypothetical protein